MIPVCRLTTYKDVPYTFLFMNRIRTPKEKDRDSDSGGSAAGSSHGGGGRYFSDKQRHVGEIMNHLTDTITKEKRRSPCGNIPANA